MPRMNLTDEEAEVVERFRLKNLEVTAFNAGLDRARELFEAWYVTSSATGNVDLAKFHEACQSERRSVRF
jgi:hypothetical protein